ncbi:MAG: glycosyltransferase [Desulfovibrio sp.]|nr:glycosyltransferase [Desulfovibrio sp.]
MPENEGHAAEKRVAYVLLWFPRSTETFIFREVVQLRERGLPIFVYTLYGASPRGCSEEMRAYAGPVRRMGVRALGRMLGAFFRRLKQEPRTVLRLLREGWLRRQRDAESFLENQWAFFAGFLLAEQCREDKVSLIHAPWANGPATAAWVASRLTGIPFMFTGRAGDIYPPDALLREKSRDAVRIRANNAANIDWLASFCPKGQEDKVRLIYNSLTFTSTEERALPVHKTFRLLAVGRLVPKKGFADLFTAIARLVREGFPVRLTLVGDGYLRLPLLRLRERLGLADVIEMPGFLPHDKIPGYFRSNDLLVMPCIIQNGDGNRDGIPNVIMEALSQCMPVVATDVCGIAEVVRDGETGLLVPQHDPAALARAVRRMSADREKALAMARAGRELVLGMFDEEKNNAALREMYLSAAGGEGGQHA